MHASAGLGAILGAVCGWVLAVSTVQATPFELMTGVDADHWPGPSRTVVPVLGGGNSQNGTFYDDDRLAGTGPLGPVVTFIGVGQPLLNPNEFGALSLVFKRSSVPLGFGQAPYMGIDFLGGPLLDLDGNAGDASRSLIPVDGEDAVVIPDTTSTIDLLIDTSMGTVDLLGFDSTSTSEGGPGVSWKVGNAVNVLAGTEPDNTQTGPINPDVDTRVGLVSMHVASNGAMNVWRIEDLGYEFWQDTLLENSASADELGTFQFLGALSGWYVKRDPTSREFPSLTDAGLGQTPWPIVGTDGLGETFVTANGLAGGMATINAGVPNDMFDAPNNGGTTPTDLGEYFDTVVIPNVSPFSDGFVYLESLGFGINNSGDPVYFDSIGYDIVIVAQQNQTTDLWDYAGLQRCTAEPVSGDCAAFDFDEDADVDSDDYAAFEALLTGPDV
jgi:hypothetical protein